MYMDSDSRELASQSDEINMEDRIIALDKMETLVAELSEEHRCAILLIAEGMTYEEISQIEGCPVNTAKTRVFNARRILRDKLKDHQKLEEPHYET